MDAIFIIEVVPPIKKFLVVNLSKRGYLVGCMDKTEKVYQEMLDFRPNILILDIGFCEGWVQDFVYDLITHEVYHLIPIIITTTLPQHHLIDTQYLNIRDHLQKPYGVNQLMSAVTSLN